MTPQEIFALTYIKNKLPIASNEFLREAGRMLRREIKIRKDQRNGKSSKNKT